MNPIPSTPTVAIARELRRLGLKQGAMGDFTVAGHYVRKERRFSYVTVTSKEAERLLVEHADEIEERTANGPFPFKVSVRYVGDIPFIDIHNGPAERVRELPESARRAAAEQPAEAAEQAPEAIEATEATEATETDAPAAEQAPDPLAVPAGLYVVPRMSTRLHDWYGLECGRCTPGVRQELPGEWDNRADAARAAQDHYEFTHRPADDVLSLEELEELERWPLSAAQYQVLSYARHGQLQEFADGFWALDVNPCKFDVNKKVAAARVTRMWTAGLLGVRADGPGARLFVLTKTGRRVADLLWRAQRQGLRTEVPAKDAALAPEPGRPTSYPTLAEGRYFVGEERPQAPAAEETQAPEEAPAEPAPVAEEAPAAPAMDWRDEQAAKALGWSTKHAAAVRAAVDGHLVRDEDGTPAWSPAPAWAAPRSPPAASCPWRPPGTSSTATRTSTAAARSCPPPTPAAPWPCGTTSSPPPRSADASRSTCPWRRSRAARSTSGAPPSSPPSRPSARWSGSGSTPSWPSATPPRSWKTAAGTPGPASRTSPTASAARFRPGGRPPTRRWTSTAWTRRSWPCCASVPPRTPPSRPPPRRRPRPPSTARSRPSRPPSRASCGTAGPGRSPGPA